MRDARAEVTSRVDGVPGGTTEGGADTDDQKAYTDTNRALVTDRLRTKTPPSMKSASKPDFPLIERISRRAFAHMVAMIHVANNRDDADKTDPKVGGHPAACASAVHVLGALHLVVDDPRVRKLFDITGLDQVFDIHPSLVDALGS